MCNARHSLISFGPGKNNTVRFGPDRTQGISLSIALENKDRVLDSRYSQAHTTQEKKNKKDTPHSSTRPRCCFLVEIQLSYREAEFQAFHCRRK